MNYTIRVAAVMVAISACVYSCAWYNVEHEKQNSVMMKTCMDMGHTWKEARWVRDWHYCE